MDRHTTADTAGNSLTVSAGGATSGATDKNGGDLVLSSGTATGTGSSKIEFKTSEAGGAGSTDNTPQTAMTILGNGNVGIGETNPGSKLVVNGDIVGQAFNTEGGEIRLNNVANSTHAALIDVDAGDNARFLSMTNGDDALIGLAATNTTGNLRFMQAGYSEAMRIDSDGDVGVGTINPQEKLHIQGDAAKVRLQSNSGRVTMQIRSDGTAIGSADSPVLQLSRQSSSFTQGNVGEIRFDGLGSGGAYTEFGGIYVHTTAANTPTGAESKMIFNTNDSTGSTTKMALTGEGRLGVGTASPARMLHVLTDNTINAEIRAERTGGVAVELQSQPSLGSVQVVGANPLTFATNAAERVRIAGDGDVGIGTTNPQANFHLVGDEPMLIERNNAGAYIALFNNIANPADETVAGLIDFHANDSTATRTSYGAIRGHVKDNTDGSEDGEINFYTTEAGTFTEQMTLSKEGNLGIGLVDPTSKLQLNHNAHGLVFDSLNVRTSLPFQSGIFSNVGGDSKYGDLAISARNDYGGFYDIMFFTAATDNTPVERMTIKSSGRLGIGNSAPESDIHFNTPNDGIKLQGSGDYGFLFSERNMHLSENAYYDPGANRWTAINDGFASLVQTATSTDSKAFIVSATTSSQTAGSDINAALVPHFTVRNDGNIIQGPIANYVNRGSGYYIHNDGGDSRNVFRIDAYANDLAVVGVGEAGTASDTSISFVPGTVAEGISPSVKMRIQGNGNVGIGTTSISYKLHVNGSVAGVGAYNNISDRRYKKDFKDIADDSESALDKLGKLNGKYFFWREDEFPDLEFEQGRDMGVIAQEVEAVFPEAVTTAKDGYKSVAYSKLIAPLIEATKELDAKIEENLAMFNMMKEGIDLEQNRRIASLEEEVIELKEENKELKSKLDLMQESLCEINPSAKICEL